MNIPQLGFGWHFLVQRTKLYPTLWKWNLYILDFPFDSYLKSL